MRYFPRVRHEPIFCPDSPLSLTDARSFAFRVGAERPFGKGGRSWVTFYPRLVAIVSVFSTRVAVLGNKMRYLFPAFLRYSNCTQDDVALSASLAVIYGAELLPTEGLL